MGMLKRQPCRFVTRPVQSTPEYCFILFSTDRHRRLAQSLTSAGRRMSWSADENTRRGTTEIVRSEEHTSELQSRPHLVCRLLLEKKTRTDTGVRSTPSPLSRLTLPCLRLAVVW